MSLTVCTVGGSCQDRQARAQLIEETFGPAPIGPTIKVAPTSSSGYQKNSLPLVLPTATKAFPSHNHEGADIVLVIGHIPNDELEGILGSVDQAYIQGPGFNAMSTREALKGMCKGTIHFHHASECPKYSFSDHQALVAGFSNKDYLLTLRHKLVGSFWLTRQPSLTTVRTKNSVKVVDAFCRTFGLAAVSVAEYAEFECAVAAALSSLDKGFEPLKDAISWLSKTDPEFLASAIGCYQHANFPDVATEMVGKIVLDAMNKIPGFEMVLPDYDGSAAVAMLSDLAAIALPSKNEQYKLLQHILFDHEDDMSKKLIDCFTKAVQGKRLTVYTDPGLCPTLDDLYAIAILNKVFNGD